MKRRDFITTTLAGAALGAVGAGCKPTPYAAADGCAEPECEPYGCHYTRMFPHLARKPSTPDSDLEKGLAKLGASMVDRGGDTGTPAGYTYFGQLIDHDLTLDITPLEFAHSDVYQIRNHRTPLLDLDHVYGGGPTVSPYLYEVNGPPGNERFLIGNNSRTGCSPNDLPRNAQGIAIVPDPRQDENLIIAQLHVAFLKFHNFVMDELAEREASRSDEVQLLGPPEWTRFRQARRFVTWHYQYAVVHDFLRRFVSVEVFNEVKKQCSEPPIPKRPTFRLPVEFSAAAFRFGHSMARDVYNSITATPRELSLTCLLAFTGRGGRQTIPCKELNERPVPFCLPPSWEVEWPNLFDMPAPGSLNGTRTLDTGVAAALHDLRIEDVNKFSAATAHDSEKLTSPKNILPVRTLWRGARMGLPSGQEIANELGIKTSLQPDEIKDPCPEITKLILECKFHQDTPFWYYVLKEAEVHGKKGKLGPVGSRIVADVVVAALKADRDSYVSVNPNWKPTVERMPELPIGRIPDILYFVKRREPRKPTSN